MQAKLHTLTISTDVLRRGFWLYVWAVALRHGKQVYYVGRTGDSSSIHAQSPFLPNAAAILALTNVPML